MTTVWINGVTGRMGQTLLETGADREDVTVTGGVASGPSSVDAVPTYSPDEAASRLPAEQPDAVVDFSTPAGTETIARACREATVPLVVGTTDLGGAAQSALDTASEQVPVLQASNFARGVQAFLSALDSALASLPDYDVEVLETHHSGKQDAPSGTAETILSTVSEHREFESVAGREGQHFREHDEVGMLVRRAGDVRGEHEVMLAGNDECLTLTHRAEDRGVFAAGALDAAVWLDGRGAGRYDFTDVGRTDHP